MSKKGRVFWPLLIAVFASDCTTKHAAVQALSPPGTPHEVLGETLRLTLAFNRGGAMGTLVGPHAKVTLGFVGLAVVTGLLAWYWRSRPDDTRLAAALALLTAGALGNAWQRLLSARGVVDFIDVGAGGLRFWTFNVADGALTFGVLVLWVAIWQRSRERDTALE